MCKILNWEYDFKLHNFRLTFLQLKCILRFEKKVRKGRERKFF